MNRLGEVISEFVRNQELASRYGQLHPRILIVADDLTGACDAAVGFAQRGAHTQVLIDSQWTSSAPVQVRAICTESRDLPVTQAVERLSRIVRQSNVQPHHHVFKKIDSVFRGNTSQEIQAAIEAFPDRFAVIAPSFPALGRTAVDGTIIVRDIAGERTILVRKMLEEIGLRPTWIAAGQSAEAIEQAMRANHESGQRAVFCDAATEDDLAAIVAAGRRLPNGVQWIGSGGLAHALASDVLGDTVQADYGSGPIAKSTVFVFVGTDHPVTLQQLSTLHQQHNAAIWPSGIDMDDVPVVVFPVSFEATTEDGIRSAMARFTKQQIGCLFMTGGDTAMLVCRALGIRALSLKQEFEPGIPTAVAIGGDFSGAMVVLKSGGFGEAEAISRIAKHFGSAKHQGETIGVGV